MTTQATSAKPAGSVFRRSDAILASAVVGIVAMMIIPLPTMLLDVLIILNITLSLTVLLVALNIRELSGPVADLQRLTAGLLHGEELTQLEARRARFEARGLPAAPEIGGNETEIRQADGVVDRLDVGAEFVRLGK